MQRQRLLLPVFIHGGMEAQQSAGLAHHQIRPMQRLCLIPPQTRIQGQHIGQLILARHLQQLNGLCIRQSPPLNSFLAACVRPLDQFKGIDSDPA